VRRLTVAGALAGSVALTWPALLLADELPRDRALNGKFDDFVTGGILAVLLAGLIAAGWLRPLWMVLTVIVVLGVGVPLVYEALDPTVCRSDISGMDCLHKSFAALLALPGVVVMLCSALVRRLVARG
jgi:hypothetical protein